MGSLCLRSPEALDATKPPDVRLRAGRSRRRPGAAPFGQRYDLNRQDGERIIGRATYSDYRRFQVDVKIRKP